jgi:hypothetical protein
MHLADLCVHVWFALVRPAAVTSAYVMSALLQPYSSTAVVTHWAKYVLPDWGTVGWTLPA